MDAPLATGLAGGFAFLVGEVLASALMRRRPFVREAIVLALGAAVTFTALAVVGVNPGAIGAIAIGVLIGGVAGLNLPRSAEGRVDS
jgi:hypothetical protein